MASPDTEVLSVQLTLFGDGKVGVDKPARIYTLGQVLTRQQLRAYILSEHQELEPPDIAIRMGCAIDTVYGLLSRANDRLNAIVRYSKVIDEPYWSSQDIVDSGIRAGIRCQNCHLLLPCRTDEQPGPCEPLAEGQYDALMNLLQCAFGNGKVSKNRETPGKAVWATDKRRKAK